MRCIEADSLGYQGAPASGVGSATEVHGVMCDGIQTHSSKSSLSKTVSAEAARAPSCISQPCRHSEEVQPGHVRPQQGSSAPQAALPRPRARGFINPHSLIAESDPHAEWTETHRHELAEQPFDQLVLTALKEQLVLAGSAYDSHGMLIQEDSGEAIS